MQQAERRREKLRRLIRKEKADAILVTDFTNVTYLTGFTGDDSYLLVTSDGAILLTDSRYTVQLGEECPGLDLDVRTSGTSMYDAISKVVGQAKIGTLVVEADSMTITLHNRIESKLAKTELVAIGGLVERLRTIKDAGEVKLIRRAVDMAERAFGVIRASLVPEQTEKQVADAMENQIRQFGGRCCGFPSIIAVGPRAALPHAVPTGKRVGESNLLLMDFGANERLYISDLTRVLVTGKISSKLQRIYEVVLKANLAGIAAIKPGVLMCEVDAAARKVIEDAGFGKQFGHGLGHGIGLEVHEAPRFVANQREPLKAGMVVTVEPGIYFQGWGGVRIEDDVLVTKAGHEVLSTLPKDLDECVVG